MGAKTGKLALHPLEPQQTTANAVADEKASQSDAAAHVNGEATNLNDVPLIDGCIESSKDGPNLAAGGDKPPGQNGNASGAISESSAQPASEVHPTKEGKKRKNPILWIQRRLSKKSITASKQPEEAEPAKVDASKPLNGTASPHPEELASAVTATEGDVAAIAETTVAPTDQSDDTTKIEDTATNLVDEVVASCEATVASEFAAKDASPTAEKTRTENLPDQTEPAIEAEAGVVEQEAAIVSKDEKKEGEAPQIEEPALTVDHHEEPHNDAPAETDIITDLEATVSVSNEEEHVADQAADREASSCHTEETTDAHPASDEAHNVAD